MDRLRFLLANEFFKNLGEFHNLVQRCFFSIAKELYSQRLINRQQPDGSHLRVKDAEIARQGFALMTSEEIHENDKISWEIVLKNAAKRVESLVIEDWAKNVYYKIEQMIAQSNIDKGEWAQNFLNEIVPGLGVVFEEQIAQEYQSLVEQMKGLFLTKTDVWKKYLDPSGKGIRSYILKLISGQLPYNDQGLA